MERLTPPKGVSVADPATNHSEMTAALSITASMAETLVRHVTGKWEMTSQHAVIEWIEGTGVFTTDPHLLPSATASS